MIIVIWLITFISGFTFIYSHKEIRRILEKENQKVKNLYDIEDLGLFYRLAKYNSHLERKRKLFWIAVFGIIFFVLGIVGLAIML